MDGNSRGGGDAAATRELASAREELAALRAENERLQAELSAERARRRRSEDRSEISRVLFEHSSDANLLFDETGIVDCNNATLRMLRCEDKEKVLALHPAVFSPEFQPDGRTSAEKSQEMDRTARERGYHRFEWMHKRIDGELFPVEVTLTPVQLARGPALLVVWHDLSEFKAREEELRAQLELIRAQQAEMRRMAMPVIVVGDGVLMVPVLGELDDLALAGLGDSILDSISRASAHTLIIDLTGLSHASTSTATALGRLLDAARLLGVACIVVGIQPEVARGFAETGVGLTRARVLGSMRDALRFVRGR